MTILVNVTDTTEVEFEWPNLNLTEALAYIGREYPTWTSLVITIVKG